MKKNIFCKMKRLMLITSVISLIFGFSACSDDTPETNTDAMKKTVKVMMSTLVKQGNTDYTDYNSIIQKAVTKWENDPQYDVTVFYPKTLEEAKRIYLNWVSTSKDEKSLMVLANREFETMVNETKVNLADNQQVLAFELELTNPQKGIHAFVINHAGLAYLTGTMAALYENATVLLGYDTPGLEVAYTKFVEGFKKYNKTNCKKIYVSDGFDGFTMPEKAYEIVKKEELRNHFILPLAGLSNEGVYNYLNECEESDKENAIISAGVDIDCSDKSVRIPFSYMINIDKAIDDHLKAWYNNEPWPEGPLGLEKGITSIKINPNYTEVNGVKKADFEKRYQENFEEAKRKD